jgi:hypothetical protein
MKIVVLCQRGNTRAAAVAWYLKRYLKHEVIAAGFVGTSRKTRRMLYNWSDVIICVAKRYAHWVPEEYRHKLKIWNIGRGRWFPGYHEDLIALFVKYIEKDEL